MPGGGALQKDTVSSARVLRKAGEAGHHAQRLCNRCCMLNNLGISGVVQRFLNGTQGRTFLTRAETKAPPGQP